jgi:hypothetical protein
MVLGFHPTKLVPGLDWLSEQHLGAADVTLVFAGLSHSPIPLPGAAVGSCWQDKQEPCGEVKAGRMLTESPDLY